MRFLLTAVNAKYIHSNPALYSLRAFVPENYRNEVEIAEYTINNRTEEILADIYRKQPDVIAFSCYIWNWEVIQEIIVELHKILPKLPIWLGGPEVSFDGEMILGWYPMITGIMLGEGELTFCELLISYVDKKEDISHIRGLLYRQDNHLIRTGVRELTNMDTLPFLYDHLEDFTNRIIYYESARGCPYRCSYCLSSIDKSVRFRDLTIVKKELQYFLDHQVAQVKFVDRTFNCNHTHALEIWRYLIEHDNGVTNFHFEIAADIITEEELVLLNQMRPGLAQLEIGVQSTNPQTLQAIHRRMQLSRLEEVVATIRQGENIHVHLDLIAGLPYEDYASFGQSFDEVYAMQPEQLQLGFLKVLKGSEMCERAEEFGVVYTTRPPYEVLYTKWLPYEDVLRLKQIEEMVELYYNSNQFTHTLPVLVQNFTGPFAMYERLAQFYEEKHYFTYSPARAYRYQVLLDFACTVDEIHRELYQELLTYDLYLRENCKSRPEYSADLTPYKDRIWEFYVGEEKNRQFLPEDTAYTARQMQKMTHMDAYHYPVWEKGISTQTRPSEQATLVLYDYKRRNPLTDGAAVTVLRRLT